MRLYPASVTGLSRTLAGDVAVILVLCLFGWLGFKVHDGIAELAAVGRGIQDSGRAVASSARQTTSAVEGAFNDAAGRVDGLPLGWLTFGIPALLPLSRVLAPRIGGIVRMTRAQRMLRGAPEDILAARAAYNLPYGQLDRYIRDPFGELAEGRHAALLAALADDAGVNLRG